jgi:16S rRNA (uracil1498-N3)-methyltransferase
VPGAHPQVTGAPPRVTAERRNAAAHVLVADVQFPHLADADLHHLRSVLRLRPGEAVSVTDGKGSWRLCRYRSDGLLEADSDVVQQTRPEPLITVAFAAVKGDRPEWAVQKLTEVGVDRIVLLRTDLGVVRWEGERAQRHLERLRGVARQAVRQSRQVWLPDVSGPTEVGSLRGAPGVAMAVPGGEPPNLSFPTVLVGPEGGWSPVEESRAQTRVDLGAAVLRTESAAVVAGVLLTSLRAGLVRPARS